MQKEKRANKYTVWVVKWQYLLSLRELPTIQRSNQIAQYLYDIT